MNDWTSSRIVLPRRVRGSALVAVLAIPTVVAAVGSRSTRTPGALLDAALAGADATRPIELVVGEMGTRPSLRIGRDALVLTVHSPKPGHLVVIQAGTDGQSVDLLFPNDLDGNTRIEAGTTRLPRKGWQLAAAGPAGEGALLAIVTDEAPDITAVRAALAERRLPAFGRYGAAQATWREVDDERKAQ